MRADELNHQLLDRLRAAGAIRPDIEVADLGLIFEQLASVRLGDEAHASQLRHRYLALIWTPCGPIPTARYPGRHPPRRSWRPDGAGEPALDAPCGTEPDRPVGALAVQNGRSARVTQGGAVRRGAAGDGSARRCPRRGRCRSARCAGRDHPTATGCPRMTSERSRTARRRRPHCLLWPRSRCRGPGPARRRAAAAVDHRLRHPLAGGDAEQDRDQGRDEHQGATVMTEPPRLITGCASAPVCEPATRTARVHTSAARCRFGTVSAGRGGTRSSFRPTTGVQRAAGSSMSCLSHGCFRPVSRLVRRLRPSAGGRAT